MSVTERELKAVSAFADIARALTGSLEMEEVLRRIAEEARALTNADGVGIIMRRGGAAEFVAHDTAEGSLIPVGFRVEAPETLAALLADREEPLVVENARKSALIPPEIRKRIDIQDVILVPLRLEGNTIGVLSLAFHSLPERWRTGHVLLSALAGQASIALHNAQLYERARTSTERLLHAEKLSALGRLLARIAHELDNPLTTIRLLSELLELDELSSAALEHVQALAREAEFAADIVSDLLLFSRPGAGLVLEPMRLDEAIRDAVARQSGRAAAIGARIAIDLPPQLPAVHVDRRSLRHVLANLLKNALQALEHAADERRIVVRARRSGGGDAARVVVEVEDTGPGIPAEIEAELFDPFVTTKGVGEGTGLGLAIVKDIVEAHGGRVAGRNIEGGGALFRFDLTAVTGADDTAGRQAGVPESPPRKTRGVATARKGAARKTAPRKPAVRNAAREAAAAGAGAASAAASGDEEAQAAGAVGESAADDTSAGRRRPEHPACADAGAAVRAVEAGGATDAGGAAHIAAAGGGAARMGPSDESLEGLRVLVIDDEAGLQRAIRRVLERMGCRVSSALTGDDGLRQARGSEFDLILCDVRMPGLDGRTLYARLGDEVPYAKRALVFMTGDVLAEETREFLEEVGSTVLVKPFGREQLFQTIRQHLGLPG